MISINPRRLLSQAALVFGVLLLSAGVQTLAAFSEPSVAPPGADANAPLTTGPNAEAKEGGLLLNTGGADNGLIVQLGKVGIGTDAPTQLLDVAGYVKATGICIADDCRTAWPDGGSGMVGGSVVYKVPGTYTYTVPNGVTNIQALVIGGGGGSASQCTVTTSQQVCSTTLTREGCTTGYITKYETSIVTKVGGNAKNGQSIVKTIPVTPGQQFTITVGAGGATDFGGAASCFGGDVAKGGDASWYDPSGTSFGSTITNPNNTCTRGLGLATCGTAPTKASTYYAGTGAAASGGGNQSSSGSVEILNLP